ncbi:ATP-NAD/AcoX kinase [mine drainage metagenome]|uniref:ATP-NAD/AcoX kinase n=1 Tax=mine drainage metagenome TaxID=410659 RepID=T1A6Q1_9ZZZZ
MKVAFVINPIAGYGFYSNNKDTRDIGNFDRNTSIALKAADIFLNRLDLSRSIFVVPTGIMGQDLVELHQGKILRAFQVPDWPTTEKDTENFVKSLSRDECDVLVFVGGDGTARCIQRSLAEGIPVLGVPSGLKMYSGIYAISPEKAAIAINAFIDSEVIAQPSDIMDMNEDGKIVNFGTILGLSSPLISQSGKTEYSVQGIADIEEYVIDNMHEDSYYIIGTGSTCKSIEDRLGVTADPLCIDLYRGKKLLRKDASEHDLLSLPEGGNIQLILSPLGGQGFLFGHGNRQITWPVIKKVGFDNILVISSTEKLSSLRHLYAYVPDSRIPAFVRVLYGYGRFRVLRLVS